jgi:NADH-ubiquinone oxidoreductase chain 4
MIICLLLVPLIGVLFLSNYSEDSIDSKIKMKQIALFTSLINLILSIKLWLNFDFNCTNYQFVLEFNELNFCHFHLGIDGISIYFVLLTTFITPLCILSN